jgi:hypothetical protein
MKKLVICVGCVVSKWTVTCLANGVAWSNEELSIAILGRRSQSSGRSELNRRITKKSAVSSGAGERAARRSFCQREKYNESTSPLNEGNVWSTLKKSEYLKRMKKRTYPPYNNGGLIPLFILRPLPVPLLTYFVPPLPRSHSHPTH